MSTFPIWKGAHFFNHDILLSHRFQNRNLVPVHPDQAVVLQPAEFTAYAGTLGGDILGELFSGEGKPEGTALRFP